MASYLEELMARRERTQHIYDLYNANLLEELLVFYDDDVVSCMPSETGHGAPKMHFAQGKAAYREQLRRFRSLHGRLTVLDVFPAAQESSVTFRDEHGRVGTFSIGLSAEGRINRIFYHEAPADVAKLSRQGALDMTARA